jgi:acetyltransferase-like isoleucine patch superfamily enzyme
MKKFSKLELRKIWLMKAGYRLVCLLGLNHQKYIRKRNLFALFGQKVLYQTHFLPNNPKRVKIHDNVCVAANVVFYEHDVINMVFERYDPSVKLHGHHTCIEIMDNCFIGGSSIIIGNVRIGPNAIVGGGSVVTKDVPPGTIVAGNPAKVIGSFYDLLKKRQTIDAECNGENQLEKLWQSFYDKRSGC